MLGLLLALGFAGAATSLAVQRWQSKSHAAATAHELTGGDARLGKIAFRDHGCGGCHSITAFEGADGKVGPALDGVAARSFIAGDLPNDPQHLIAWIQHPQAHKPGVGMPETGLTDAQARDVAAYLYTLK
jgi:cytochrome c2